MQEPSLKALVLCSAGIDSVYNLLKAKKELKQVGALLFSYGQKAQVQEYSHVKKICSKLGIKLIKIDLSWYKGLNSALLDDSIKIQKYKNAKSADKSDTILEWVPNRNGVFVNIAAAIAESSGVKEIIVGINKEEASRYPDNSKMFLNRMNEGFKMSTLMHPRLRSYSLELNKVEILKELAPLMKATGIGPKYMWSCYENFEKMCGSCESCVRLKGAISKNKMECEWKGLFLR